MFCLSSDHTTCPVYTQEPASKRVPENVFYRRKRVLPHIRAPYILLAMLLAGAGLLVALLYTGMIKLPAFSLINPEPTEVTDTPVLEVLLPTLTPTPIPTATITHTPIPPSPTPTPIQPLMLETPVGPFGKEFIVHKVLPGEALVMLADMYFTSPEAIRTVNYQMPVFVWEDMLLVVPYRHRDVSNIAPMSVYQVTEENMTMETLARKLVMDANLLLEYNQRPSGYILQEGEYVLIPYPQVLTPTQPLPWERTPTPLP